MITSACNENDERVQQTRDENIVGGAEAAFSDFPFLTAILDINYPTDPFCGATRIAKRWVITAAHCLDDSDKDEIRIRLFSGSLNYHDNKAQDVRVDKIIIHPEYSAEDYPNGDSSLTSSKDIALIKLEEYAENLGTILPVFNIASEENEPIYSNIVPLSLDDILYGTDSYVQDSSLQFATNNFHSTEINSKRRASIPVVNKISGKQSDWVNALGNPILPANSPEYPRKATTAGWGLTKEPTFMEQLFGVNSETSDTHNALTAEINVLESVVCRSALAEVYGDPRDDLYLCAGLPAGGTDTCQGDSGGPLIIKDADRYPILIGIVSTGVGCARAQTPGTYTHIGAFSKWISEEMSHNESQSTSANQFEIRGVITVNSQEIPKPVQVTAWSQSTSQLVGPIMTNTDGSFLFQDILPGTYNLTINRSSQLNDPLTCSPLDGDLPCKIENNVTSTVYSSENPQYKMIDIDPTNHE